jgi:hypothetical protein
MIQQNSSEKEQSLSPEQYSSHPLMQFTESELIPEYYSSQFNQQIPKIEEVQE